jgi:hypothetical protein
MLNILHGLGANFKEIVAPIHTRELLDFWGIAWSLDKSWNLSTSLGSRNTTARGL